MGKSLHRRQDIARPPMTASLARRSGLISHDFPGYHVLELQIACNPADARRVMPAVASEHRRILDVGCGAGQTLFAARLDADVTAIGIDEDFGALELGRRIAGRFDYICAKGESLPLKGG